MAIVARPGFERRLRSEIDGEVFFDLYSRGRYATDASHYQMMPAGVVVPRTTEAAVRALALAREEGAVFTPRGGGTSQCGQTINSGLIVDGSKHLNQLISLDLAGRRCWVQPGIVLDDLNRMLKPHGLWFPVDVSTASRATIGGMAGNNSCGGRSLRYGTMRTNVLTIDAVMADGTAVRLGETAADLSELTGAAERAVAQKLLAIGGREADEVRARFPKVQRRVGGYNLDALDPALGRVNLAHILVGSEGTLAYSTAIELKLWPVLGKRAVGVCHFGSFQAAMESAQHLVTLKPIAVELVDSTMLDLASAIDMFRPTLKAMLNGEPEAILLVEFDDGEEQNRKSMRALHDMMGDLGFAFDKLGPQWGGVVDVCDPGLQAAIAELRASGLNIMMSMKDQAKPVSFVEDCAVPLEHLAEYTERLTECFARHGTRGTWYAHASEGCLHVRPVLNLRLEKDVKAMRAIAEEAFAMVREFKGSHSGEHGDGLVRSEFNEPMFGSRLQRAFEEVKDLFDPTGLLNPGKIVRAPDFDVRGLFRYPADYSVQDFKPALDWSEFPGAIGGFQGAAEQCNNNGACRKSAGGAMCPSYRVTRDEMHVTRGRANTLRLAISGQLGPSAFTSDEMAESLSLCVSCKACKRECPTGVDMARLKIEVLSARHQRYGLSLRERLVAYLPRYAPLAARFGWLLNLRNRFAVLRALSQAVTGFSARRDLPSWTRRFSAPAVSGPEDGLEIVLWADTFNAAFEPENLADALKVLTAAGYSVRMARPVDGSRRPLCCGRTFLSVGDVENARAEMRRTVAALMPAVERGAAVVGLEPSCMLTFRDELQAVMPGEAPELAVRTFLLEELIASEPERFAGLFAAGEGRILLHGHCHQKAFNAMDAVEATLKMVPGLETQTVETSCCGMAGAFGYQAETLDVSLAMAEISLLPTVRAADAATMIVADGTSCRCQIEQGSGRKAVHVARLLAARLVDRGAAPAVSPN